MIATKQRLINKLQFPLLSRLMMILFSLFFVLLSSQSSISFSQTTAQKGARQLISAHGISGRAWLPEVELVVEELELDGQNLLTALEPQMIAQLKYLVGQFNGLEGGLALPTLKISDLQKREVSAEGLATYRYTAEFNAILSSQNLDDLEESKALSVFLPQRVDQISLADIFQHYSKDCVPHPFGEYNAENYWYYFRPNAYYCPLGQPDYSSRTTLKKTTVYFDKIEPNKNNISPHYQAMWQDERLVVTAVYALVGGLLAEQGQEGYEMVFKDLVRTYGHPISINNHIDLNNHQRLDIDTPVLEAEFTTDAGILEVHLFLINSLDQPSHVEGDPLESFFEDYERLTQISDLIIYNGHARYGSNNSKLDQLGRFIPKKHQLFFVNTCGSYTYGLPRLTQLSEAVNQAELYPSAYLDLVLNAMPAMGHEIAFMNLRFIHALVQQQDSYLSILQGLYPKQQLLVLADENKQLEEMKADFLVAQDGEATPQLLTVESVSQSGCESRKRSKLPLYYYVMLILLLIGIIRLNSFR